MYIYYCGKNLIALSTAKMATVTIEPKARYNSAAVKPEIVETIIVKVVPPKTSKV